MTECSATCNAGGKITQLRECNDDYTCSLFDPDLRLVDCNVDVPCPGNKLVIGEWTLMVRLGFVSGGRGMVGGLWTVVGLQSDLRIRLAVQVGVPRLVDSLSIAAYFLVGRNSAIIQPLPTGVRTVPFWSCINWRKSESVTWNYKVPIDVYSMLI